MKKLILPLIVFVLGLAVAQYFFDIDVEELFKGFGSFVADILKGGNR